MTEDWNDFDETETTLECRKCGTRFEGVAGSKYCDHCVEGRVFVRIVWAIVIIVAALFLWFGIRGMVH